MAPRAGPLEDGGVPIPPVPRPDEAPDPPQCPDEPGLTVAAVARRLGVAPATLRTWDRRYGLGPGSHRAGTRRRYTLADLSRLALMRRLTLEGLPPAQAAQVALSAAPGLLGAPPAPAPAEGAPTRPGGGRVVALPRAEPTVRGLARAAMALDSTACLRTLHAHLEERGVIATWEELLIPVLVAMGERWAVTGQGVDVEHLLSECVLSAMRRVVDRHDPRVPLDGAWALLASAEAEAHSLPVHVLAAALAEREVPARVLGAALPREALAAAVRRSGPAAVFVWSQRPQTGVPEQLADLPTLRPAPRLLVGGPGWAREALPAGVLMAESLTEAVELIRSATLR